jgi:Low specificity phosphatase (HAD superfamily)
MINKIKCKEIELIVYDFDGVMTDNKVLISEDGKESVFCNRSDGLAISKIKKMGLPQLIISTEKNKIVEMRAKKLGIQVIHGIDCKKSIVKKYCKEKNINLGKVIFIGNDINDLEVMKIVGYPIAPSDAHTSIKNEAKFLTKAKGGEGVIRELLNKLES